MADTFNVKNYLRENRLGAYRLLGDANVDSKLNEAFDGFGGVQDLYAIGDESPITGKHKVIEAFDEDDDFGSDNPEDDYGPIGGDEQSNDRIMGLGGDQISKAVKFLIDDGFDKEDIIDWFSGLVNSLEAGQDSTETAMNEYEVNYSIIDGVCYRINDEGDKQKVSMSYCR